ncbi:MAG: DUF4270 family protein [Bacteroidales bacterium]
MPIMIFMTSFYRNETNTGKPALFKKIKFNFLFRAITLLTFVFFGSCTEHFTEIGIDLLPRKDFSFIRSNDTITVESFTEYRDSVSTRNKTYSYLGGLYDPYFGNVSSDFVAQLRLTQRWPSGGDYCIIDSVKLYLNINGAKGQLGVDQIISLYEITEKLSSDSTYYSTRDPHAGYFIGSFPLPKVEKDTSQQLEISLPLSFGEYLIRDTTMLFQESGEKDFRDFFKGIYVTVSERDKNSGKGIINGGPLLLIFAFETSSSSSPFYITLYYHTYNQSNLTYYFIINNNSVRYNRYYHDFSTAQPELGIKHINDGLKDTLSYLQSLYGVYTRIIFKGLSSFRDSLPMSVNRARITIPVYTDKEIYITSAIPSPIYLIYKSDEGYNYIVPDYYMSSDFYGGQFNTSTLKFTFNIAAFVQSYLEGEIPDPELIMSLGDNEYRNVILKANNSSSPVKFELTYIRY